jgi:hypothetical protein
MNKSIASSVFARQRREFARLAIVVSEAGACGTMEYLFADATCIQLDAFAVDASTDIRDAADIFASLRHRWLQHLARVFVPQPSRITQQILLSLVTR